MSAYKERSIKVLQVSKYYYPVNGGIETVVNGIAEALVKDGHDVTVLCSSQRSLRTTYESHNGVKVTRLASFGQIMSLPITPLIFWELLSNYKKYDIIQVHSPNPLVELACMLLPKKVRLVCTYHADSTKPGFINYFYNKLINKFLQKVEKVYVPTKKHISSSDVLPSYKSKIEIIDFGIKTEFFEQNTIDLNMVRDFRNKYGRFVIFVGRFVNYKGISVLVDAIKESSYNVLLVGDGPLKKEITKQIYSEKLDEKVFFFKQEINDKTLKHLYYAAEALILPSISKAENYGMVQLEAMTCSLPTIVSNLNSGITEAGVIGKTTLEFEPGNSQDLQERLQTLYHNVDLRRKMSQQARKHVLYKKNYRLMGKNHLLSFERLLRKSS